MTSPEPMVPKFELDRVEAVPAVVGDPDDFLIISGLAGASKDMAALTDDGDNLYTMAGAMGAATSMGLGLALAQPHRRVLVVTGDGELLMNVGTLATVAVAQPPNLSILCVDNGHYGETGYQRSHTSLGVDLEQIAQGAGIHHTRTVESLEQAPEAARLIRQSNSCCFVLLRVKPNPPPAYKRHMEPAACRTRFRGALLGKV